jgi:hypothetical protein
MRLNCHDDGLLFATGILMLVADHNPVALSQPVDNHRIALQERCDAERQLRTSVLMLTNPCGNVGWKP